VSEVGSIKPVDDFRSMLARRDVDLVEKAIEGIKKRIVQLVNDSILSQLYPKAIECLLALRQACVQEEESESFNRFLVDLRSYYEGKRRDDFWRLIVSQKITLIDSLESEDSSISPDEARQVTYVSSYE
jgi:ATP-dependent DNA helicase 2 subunit 2